MMDFFSEFKVTTQGSMQLAVDLETYTKFFISLEDSQVMKEFEILRALLNIFMVNIINYYGII